ncbi:hypothetical protein LRM47_00650 [Candidatus Nanosynbacter sp. TM7-076]|uniref:ADP-ribosyltransferase-containing protein n=1 Tax=Candidatus Nanosynbacter sp. TM7-076 TaxID=2902629 RepID=UPI001FB5E4C7|nr:hypothetical protein [Candidatus Nanosynbacter sp. TM7-076]MCJ1967548.1 hypothetical protein [Candidatus Nanosynbacter sp. TM7-076]
MDFFQRVGNFFSGKGWVSDDERRRKEQQVQAPVQPRPQPLQQVQQPNINRLNGLYGVNTPGLGGGTNIFSQAQQKVNPNPLQQANQATQQLNQNNQPKPLIPEKTVNDAPKVLTPQGQQDWVNKENKQIQIQNVINNPTQILKSQVQQQQPKPAPVAIQPQQQNRPQIAPSFPNPGRNPLFTQNQDSLTRALDIAKQESDKYKADQAARNDKLDNIMRARGVSEPEIAKNRQVRIDAENRAYLSEDKARRDSNIAQMAGLATLPTRSVVSFTKGAIDGAGRTVGDSGDKLSLAVADAMYGITGDESYDRIRKYIVEQGKQRNAQYDRDLGVFKKNDTDVATAYEAGQSAQRLAQDIGTGVVTGGTIPVARQFVENAADFITNANAKGKSTREMLPYAYGNAAVQAGIEKVGLDKVLSPIGKKGLTKFITGAIAEGSEEAAQQFAENAIAKHTYDPNRKYEEGVLKSGLMGAVLGGPAGMANFGAMRQTGNQPSSAMTARMNQNEATGKLEKEAIAQRQARQSSDNTSLKQAAEVNATNNQNNQLHPIQAVNVAPAVENTIPNASPALKQAVTQNMSDIQHGDVNAVATRQQTTGRLENYLIEQATKDVQNLARPEMKYKLNPEHEAQVIAYNEHITRLRQREEYLRGQGMSENAPAMINLRKAQEQAIYARDHIGEVDENGLKYKLSPEQETFFKDSKIRDENGNLKTVYHGTNSEFDQFSPLAGSSSSTRNRWGEGNYLAYDKDMANGYGVNLKEMYANITSPISDKQKTISFDQYDALHRRVNNGEPAYREDYDMYDNDMDLLWDITDNGQWKKYAQDIKDTTGKDGVIMDDMAITFSPNQTKYTNNLNPTDNPDMRFKRQAEAKIQEVQQSKELLARHLQLTGDENLVFNEWQNEMQRKALGYYDPKTDQINLNKLTEDTLNHELGHKLLTRVENKQDLLNSIRESYGDDYLINKYGSQYGNDLNLLAEEQLADGFSDYYNGRLNGEDKVRLGTRLGIPQKVLAIYDRITEAVMGLVGKQDAIKQFYAQMETGKFRTELFGNPEQLAKNTNQLNSGASYKIHETPNGRLVEIEGNPLKGIPAKNIPRKVREVIKERFQGNAYPIGDTGDVAKVTARSKNEISHQQSTMGYEDYRTKAAAAHQIDELMSSMTRIKHAPNLKKTQKPNVASYTYGDVAVKIGDRQFTVRVNIENWNNGNKTLYDISSIKETSPQRMNLLRGGDVNNSTIANNPQDVNSDKFQHPLQETINEMEANPKPRMTRELREAIDEFIYENIDPKLFLEHNDTNILGSHGLTWSIPRLHVDDLRHHLGKELAGDLPSNYKRRTGKRDIDTVAQEMGYDDIDTFIDEIKRVAEARRAERERKALLAEWRRDPDVIQEAQKMIAERHAEEAKVEAEKQKKIEEAKAEKERRAEEAKAEKERIEKQQALGEILNRGLDEGPRHKIADIVHNASVATGIDEKAVAKQFAKLAEQKGYDITGERALLNTNARAGSMLDENGRLRPIDEIAPEVKEKIKLPGAEHAVPAPTTTANTATHNTRQMIYKDEKGAYHSFYEYRNIFGKWQRTGAEAPRVTSPLQKKFIDDIRSDKAVNDEAKRAFDDGLAIQYIWRENSKGVNAELVSAFDGYMQTGDKKAYRPSDKLVTFNPDKHYIESGRVVDAETGQILGNYIEMTPDGNVTIYAGKKKMNLNMHDIDFSKIKEMRFGAGQTWTTEGIIDRITGSLRRSNSLDYFKKGGNKTKEALLNIMSETPRQANAAAVKEGNAIGEQIKDYRKNLLKQAKKHGPLKRQMLQDAVYVIEPSRPKRGEKSPSYDERLKVFEEVYGKSAAEALDQYNSFLRAVYKNLLARQNEKRVELGKDPIMERKDYITHLGEMQSGKGAIAAMYGGAKNLLSGGDVAIESRKSLPAKLAGRTGLFKPSQKFNQFAMQRVGDVKPTDPFTPLMEYSKIALHNIHMTDAITMNRSLEVAVRAASEARQEFAGKGTSGIQKLADRVDALYNSAASGNVNAEELTQVRNKLYGLERAIGRKIDGIQELSRLVKKADKFGVEKLDAKDINSLKETTNNMAESLDKMLNDVNFMKLMSDSANGLTQFVGFVQEHANRLAGKTDPFQRLVNDTEPSLGSKFLGATGRALMKQAALSKIVGNMNSVVAQTASLPALFSTTNPKALIQAFKLKNRKAILQKSDALALRYADDNLTDDTKFEKTMKTAGIPMEVVERGVIEYTFLAKYNQAINNGLSDADAVRYAERFINDTVTLRDQISTPRAYNRLLPASFLQFTREVTQQNRYVWNQMTNKQRVALAVNTAIAYSAIEALTGNKPGVDPLGTLIEIVGDWLSGGDDDDKDNSVQAKLERTIQKVAGQAVTAVPIATAVVNTATTKDDRKKLFGKESNLGRYDGTIPVVDLPRKLIDTKGKLDEAAKAREDGDDDKAEAKTKDAMYNILGQLPAGSQLKKTIQGIAAAHSGEVKDGNGETKVEFEKDNPFNLVQGALFGKNALIPVQVEEGKSSWVNMFKAGGLVANASNGMQINMPTNNNPQQKQATDNQIDLQGLNKKEAASIKKKLKKGDYTFQDGLLVNKNGNVEKGVYKKLAKSQGQGDEAYRNWMKAYDIDKTSTIKKEFTSFNATLNKLQNGAEKVDKAKTAVNMMTGKYKDLPDWVKERYYKESGYTKDQIEYGAMTSHNEVSLMDNYWRQKAQESSHEDLIQELANGRRKSITGQMFAKNGVINKLRAEGYITKQEARALNATQFDTDGNKITKDTSGGSGRSGSGRGRGRRGGRSSGGGSTSPLASATAKSMSLTSSAPKANESSAKNTSINQIGQNLISKTNTQKQITNTLKKWNGASTSKNTRIRIKKA